jgi:hypothetical protein
MEIRFVPREEIDKTKWNSCVHYAGNGNIFGYMWYLDNVAKDWDALVEGDYESVFPLVWKQGGFGGKNLVQPPWMRELGLYSIHVLSKQRIRAFVEAIPDVYGSIRLHLNEQNFLPETKGYRLLPQTNYQLLLSPSYEELAGAYGKEFFLQLAKAEKAGLLPVSSIKPELVADFYRAHGAPDRDRDTRAHALLRIMYNALHRGWGFAAGVSGAGGELLAANFYLYSHGKVLSLAPVASKKGRDHGALAYLFNTLLQSHAGRPLLLDLNTAGLDGLAEEMGAKPNTFFVLEKEKRGVLGLGKFGL